MTTPPFTARRVTWEPSRNTEREALRHRPGPWSARMEQPPAAIRGRPEPCLWVWPDGAPNEGRWVGVSRITPEPTP